MPLTKARPPVTQINEMGRTNTLITVPVADNIIDIDVGAQDDVANIAETTFTINDLVQLVSRDVLTEVMTIITAAGAEATIATDADSLDVGTTNLNIVNLLMNGVASLILNADQTVSLDTVGTSAGHLIDKDYVDTAVSGISTPGVGSSITGNMVQAGSVQIPTTDGTLIINWGRTGNLTNETTTVTFDTAFPNAIFTGYCTRVAMSPSTEKPAHTFAHGLTTMGINQTGGNTSTVHWLAIGF